MSTKQYLQISTVFIMTVFFAGCKTVVIGTPPPPTTYVVYTPGENLTALTKIHETENVCDYPTGGDGGRNLFYSVRDNAGYRNIYRKDNPTNMSMSQLTGGRSHNSAPSYCAANNMVAFAGRPEGSSASDIYLVNANQGGALTQVTNTLDANEDFPCWSRDGKKIVYEKRPYIGNVINTEIWIKDLQSNENIQLGIGRTPAFSPDGRYIVFVKYSSDGKSTYLCVINADGSNLTQVTDASMGTVWRPCFSPDGKYIVFQCHKPQKRDNDLYVIDRTGNGLTQLTINNSYDAEPYWANDGNIYFTSDRGGRDGHYQIWRFKYASTQAPVGQTVGQSIVQTTESVSRYHTVKDGETITNIAKQYGITVKDLVKWNNLTTMTITPGMKLKVSAQ